MPVIAIVNGAKAGTDELQTKSLPTFEKTPATIGSSETIRNPYTDERTEGEIERLITWPFLSVMSSKPTGINRPSPEITSTLAIASDSPGARSRSCCAGALLTFG